MATKLRGCVKVFIPSAIFTVVSSYSSATYHDHKMETNTAAALNWCSHVCFCTSIILLMCDLIHFKYRTLITC